jgi:hypothetical protein
MTKKPNWFSFFMKPIPPLKTQMFGILVISYCISKPKLLTTTSAKLNQFRYLASMNLEMVPYYVTGRKENLKIISGSDLNEKVH